MKVIYCVNGDNLYSRSLIKKLSEEVKPGAIILLSKEEMKLLTDKKQFIIVELPEVDTRTEK